jgi:hypothetical protein
MRDLVEMVKENRTIEKLNLFANKLRHDVADELYSAVCKNDTIKVLNVGYNEVTDKQEEDFKTLMAMGVKGRLALFK